MPPSSSYFDFPRSAPALNHKRRKTNVSTQPGSRTKAARAAEHSKIGENQARNRRSPGSHMPNPTEPSVHQREEPGTKHRVGKKLKKKSAILYAGYARKHAKMRTSTDDRPPA
ncbi:hypothetical protein EVG20_g11381 [Dentipellis fragilis]|uniref:Uncharacterized protein n=1 Tax=Dentipellis fragilis TaxID=205917 RepID=A0A4Y9XKY7_9AGAM|nr:hypothetical protein EVG20_g11381 [Dentipellis fragilis]